MKSKLLCFMAIAVILVPALASGHSGTVRGRVMDPEGHPIAGVTITATSPEGGQPVTATSRCNGNYAITIPELDWP